MIMKTQNQVMRRKRERNTRRARRRKRNTRKRKRSINEVMIIVRKGRKSLLKN